METFEADAVVIGGGAVGLACARALALKGRDVLVLEAAERDRHRDVLAQFRSDPCWDLLFAGSLKAQLCVAGRRKLYEYCKTHGVEAHRCGKLVVAVDDGEAAATPALLQRALDNGVEDIRPDRWRRGAATGAGAQSRDTGCDPLPRVSGLFDSHAYFLALQGEFEDRGGAIAFDSPVIRGFVTKSGIEIETGGAQPLTHHGAQRHQLGGALCSCPWRA